MQILIKTLNGKYSHWGGLRLNRDLWNWKTLGFHPKPWKFFEKNLVKLLVKCNFIAFFVNPFAIFLKFSTWWGRCHASDRWEENNVNPLIKVLTKRIKFNFFQMESGICRNFFIEKVPCTFKNLFKTAHSMCLRK